ncbi:MAG: stalk domain-containing protein [Clostridia bacterium]|nr:stalk domain-containing protein [Clostridia bacterium]
MRKWLAFFMACALCTALLPAHTLASSISVRLNGNAISFDQAPIMVNNRVLVPLRAVFEAMLATVEWNNSTRTATVYQGNSEISVTVGNSTMKVQNSSSSKNVTLDSVPQIVGGRTLVPVRAISEALGATVSWDASSSCVNISYIDIVHKGSNTNVITTRHESYGIVYYVQDIYVKSVANIRTAFANDTYGKGYREHPADIAARYGAVCAINGDYYGSTSDNGVVIRNGVLYRDNPTADVCVLFNDGTMQTYAKEQWNSATAMAAGAWQAWCFGPSLLDSSGKAKTSFDSKVTKSNPRSGIGYYAPGHYCFVSVDGRSDASEGATLAEFASLFQSLGCSVAYNLDGGKTSVMTIGSHIVNIPDSGGRTSSDIIYVCE